MVDVPSPVKKEYLNILVKPISLGDSLECIPPINLAYYLRRFAVFFTHVTSLTRTWPRNGIPSDNASTSSGSVSTLRHCAHRIRADLLVTSAIPSGFIKGGNRKPLQLGNSIYKWGIVHCHVSLLEGNSEQPLL